MADAAQVALMSLAQVTENALNTAPDADDRPTDLILIEVLHKLLDRAWAAFSSANAAVEA